MNSIQIHYFLITARNRSFSRAAEECFITQPSLSKQIKNLEKELGVELVWTVLPIRSNLLRWKYVLQIFLGICL